VVEVEAEEVVVVEVEEMMEVVVVEITCDVFFVIAWRMTLVMEMKVVLMVVKIGKLPYFVEHKVRIVG
jgi:hypothetical protein